MRIFIIPSWCPTADQPLSGTFFVEQANAIAQLRPDWTVSLIHFDLARSRFPLRPWRFPRFFRDFLIKPQLLYSIAPSGLHDYQTWSPYFPLYGRYSKWSCNISALVSQAQHALESFIQQFGKPNLIHAHSVYPGGAAAVALGQKYRIPVGLTEHVGPFPPSTMLLPGGQMLPLVSQTYAASTLCSAVSKSLSDCILNLKLVDKISILPNFLPDFYGMGSSISPAPRHGFSFLSVGGPSHAKGTDLLLHALSYLDSNVTLDIVGESHELSYFKAMAARYGLEKRVTWLGAISHHHMPDIYASCDAFVLPSRSETFGVSLIEALACGRPIIATRCGGPQDIVHDGIGILVPLNDVQSLAQGMLEMVNSCSKYTPEGIRLDFHQRFSASATIERIESWYTEIVKAGQGIS